MSRGQVQTWVIWGIVALVVLGLGANAVASTFGRTGGFNDWARSLLGFEGDNSTASNGLAIVGIDLTDSLKLKYYDGNAWIAFPQGAALKLGRKELDPSFYNKLRDFYFNTPRKSPSTFSVQNPYREFSTLPPTQFALTGKTTDLFGFYSGEDYVGDNLGCVGGTIKFPTSGVYVRGAEKSIDQNICNDIFIDVYDRIYSIDSNSNVIIKKTEGGFDYSNLINRVSDWRDQILDGQSCQKTVALTYKQDGVSVTNNYFVKRIRDKLFVDLDVVAKSDQKYGNDCSAFKETKQVVAPIAFFRLRLATAPSYNYQVVEINNVHKFVNSAGLTNLISFTWDFAGGTSNSWYLNGQLVPLSKDYHRIFYRVPGALDLSDQLEVINYEGNIKYIALQAAFSDASTASSFDNGLGKTVSMMYGARSKLLAPSGTRSSDLNYEVSFVLENGKTIDMTKEFLDRINNPQQAADYILSIYNLYNSRNLVV